MRRGREERTNLERNDSETSHGEVDHGESVFPSEETRVEESYKYEGKTARKEISPKEEGRRSKAKQNSSVSQAALSLALVQSYQSETIALVLVVHCERTRAQQSIRDRCFCTKKAARKGKGTSPTPFLLRRARESDLSNSRSSSRDKRIEHSPTPGIL